MNAHPVKSVPPRPVLTTPFASTHNLSLQLPCSNLKVPQAVAPLHPAFHTTCATTMRPAQRAMFAWLTARCSACWDPCVVAFLPKGPKDARGGVVAGNCAHRGRLSDCQCVCRRRWFEQRGTLRLCGMGLCRRKGRDRQGVVWRLMNARRMWSVECHGDVFRTPRRFV